MNWPEDIASELPEPHPEEPAQLRSDILDELYDHLLSSLEHEQLTEADQNAARKSVLSRFGNPATIACRLWWDAMWGRIMMQRITLGFVALLCCVSIVMTFIVWSAIDQSQQATAALVAQVQNLADREIVVTFPEDNSETDERFKYLEWIPVKVKLKDETGEPITDPEYSVTLHGMKLIHDSGKPNVLKEHPDENGVVDFGLVRPVVGTFTFHCPGNATMTLKEYQFRPGIPAELEITCPSQLFTYKEHDLDIQWPEDLRDKDLWVYLWLITDSREIDGQSWYVRNRESLSRSVLIDPQGRYYLTELYADEDLKTYWVSTLRGSIDPRALQEAITGNRTYAAGPSPTEPYEQRLSRAKRVLQQDVFADLSEPQSEISLVESGMRIGGIVVLKPEEPQDPEAQNISFKNLLPVMHLLGTADDLNELNPEQQPAEDRWVYRPWDFVNELVRARLAQIEAKEKPGAEETADPAEVSVKTE